MIKAMEKQNENTHFRVLRILDRNPNVSQRDIAKKLGVSLGKINYSLKALSQKGLIKIDNFSSSQNKRAYIYLITPKGVQEKIMLTTRFLRHKMAEYDMLEKEINSILKEVELDEKRR